MTKAYKALTDEEIRNNYVQYGHPDGKQSFSIGIALPKLIVTEGFGKYVLLVYGGLLGVLLPYIVGKWWYGSQRYTKERVLVASAGNMFREYKDDITDGGIVNALSSGAEFTEALKGSRADAGLGKLEKLVLAEGSTFLSSEDREAIKQMEESSRRKALALLWAYLGRVDLEDASLNGGKFENRHCNFLILILHRKIRSRPDCSVSERSIQGHRTRFRQPSSYVERFPYLATSDPGHCSGRIAAFATPSLYRQGCEFC